MGRPKKDPEAQDARQRIVEAFWKLLEDRRLSELTVGVICAEATCNRGSFYYHFDDLDSLVFSAIENELMDGGGLPNEMFNLVTGADDGVFSRIVEGRRMERLSLMMERGGMDRVEAMAKKTMLGIWRTVLCPDGSDLLPETRFVIEYAVSGMLGVLSFKSRQDAAGIETPVPERFMSEVASFMLSQIGEAQGVPQDEMLLRFKMLSRFMRLSAT